MTRPTDTDRSAALTALVVHLRDDQHMQWKQIAYRVHISESSAMRRHERVTTRARIAELERQNAELVAALAVHEERIVELRRRGGGYGRSIPSVILRRSNARLTRPFAH
jgi:hypothetical protein